MYDAVRIRIYSNCLAPFFGLARKQLLILFIRLPYILSSTLDFFIFKQAKAQTQKMHFVVAIIIIVVVWQDEKKKMEKMHSIFNVFALDKAIIFDMECTNLLTSWRVFFFACFVLLLLSSFPISRFIYSMEKKLCSN